MVTDDFIARLLVVALVLATVAGVAANAEARRWRKAFRDLHKEAAIVSKNHKKLLARHEYACDLLRAAGAAADVFTSLMVQAEAVHPKPLDFNIKEDHCRRMLDLSVLLKNFWGEK